MSSKRASSVVVILMSVVAIGLLIPAVHHLQAQASGRETAERMKWLALAIHSCNDAHKRLPPAFESFADITYPASVHVHLLRFIEQDALYRSFLEADQGKVDASIACFQSPSDATLGIGNGVQNFAANLRVFSDAGLTSYGGKFTPVPLAPTMPGQASIPRTFRDGTSNTICFSTKLAACAQQGSVAGVRIEGGSHYAADPTSPNAAFFGENAAEKSAHASDAEAAFQLAPRSFECRVWPLMAQSFAPQGITVGMGDGSVRTVAPNISANTWNQALQPNDGYSCWCGSDW